MKFIFLLWALAIIIAFGVGILLTDESERGKR